MVPFSFGIEVLGGEFSARFSADRSEMLARERTGEALRELARVKAELEARDIAANFTAWSQRLTVYEAARAELAPAPEDELGLVEMFRRRAETEADATLARDRVTNLMREIASLDIRAQPGMSGGPVFNDLDEVIGVVAFARIYTAPADTNAAVVATYNTSHAVSVTALRRMLARSGA